MVDDGGTGTLPFTTRGTGSVAGGRVQLDASATSQFVCTANSLTVPFAPP